MTQEELFNAQFLIEKGANPELISYSGLTPLLIMLALAQVRSSKRDPLKLDAFQGLLFAGIACSWLAQYCDAHTALWLNTISLLGQLAPTLFLISQAQNWKKKAAVIACDLSLSRIPGIRTAYQVFKICNIGKASLEGLTRCWRNVHLERYRSLRNGIAYTVNTAHSAKQLSDIGTDIFQKITLPGFFPRMTQFIPSCMKIHPWSTTCFSKFDEIESENLKQRIHWEQSLPGIEERYKAFFSVCQQEITDSNQCKNLFWSLEKDRYWTGIHNEELALANLPGRVKRWNDFKPECEVVSSDETARCERVFNYLELLRYQKDLKWEQNSAGITKRWNAFQPTCILDECRNVFWELELYKYLARIPVEDRMEGIEKRWEDFSDICYSQSRYNQKLCLKDKERTL